MKKALLAAALASTALLAGTAPAVAQDRWDYSGGRPDDRMAYRLIGPGVPMLFPELRRSPRGRAFVMRNFDWNHDGIIDRREADAANRAFADAAGPRRDRFDWDSHGQGMPVPPPPGPPPGPGGWQHDGPPQRDWQQGGGGWDRPAMREYGFRQTPRGATLTLSQDVLFATDSDVLRPGALDRLRPLADYLRSEPGVRVAIDGYTDSRGSQAHNQDLSERRAASVRNALDEMGVTRARFSVQGHGENDPVATNATAAGMRQNRRVEVTLLGRRADEFMR